MLIKTFFFYKKVAISLFSQPPPEINPFHKQPQASNQISENPFQFAWNRAISITAFHRLE